jgi:hypothetical protein
MPKLNDFREMIDGIDDKELLESGQQLLRDMMRIQALNDELKGLNDGLVEGGKAIFYFFAEELDEDERVYAAERISGKIKRLDRATALEQELKAKELKKQEEQAAETEAVVEQD